MLQSNNVLTNLHTSKTKRNVMCVREEHLNIIFCLRLIENANLKYIGYMCKHWNIFHKKQFNLSKVHYL